MHSRSILFISASLILSCSSVLKPVVKDKPLPPKALAGLDAFFERSRKDLASAIQVVVTEDMVKNLSHLQRMDSGGKKFYLLERENISRMIKSVTREIYSDFILINKQGTIIYTRQNDDIFSKNVRTSLKETKLKNCYDAKDLDVYYSDITELESFSGKPVLLISSKASGGQTFPGIFALQIDIDSIREYLKPGEEIVGMDGNYRLPLDNKLRNSSYPHFSLLDIEGCRDGDAHRVLTPEGVSIDYQCRRDSNLEWIVVKHSR